MQPVPAPILQRFEAILEKRAVLSAQRADYKKWLRYFWDFRSKYPLPEARSDQVRLFIDKLREKKQTLSQQNQAAHAVSLYFEMPRKGEIQEAADSDASPGSERGAEAGTSSVAEPQQVRESSVSMRQAIPPPDGGSAEANTNSFVAPAQRRQQVRRDAIFWEHEGNRALRTGKWKLVARGPQGPWELYDMEKDRTEMHDLAADLPEGSLERLQAEFA